MAAWLDIRIGGEERRHELRSGLTQIGGRGADVTVPPAPGGPGVAGGELHVWDDPPKVVRVSGPELVALDGGRATSELALTDGTRFRWGTAELRYGCDPPVLEEVPLEQAERAPALAPGELRAWHRVQAGLLVELGLADRQAVKRWQEAVKDGRFDPDACSRELLAAREVAGGDPRFADRCGGLLRDFLMAPLLRGARGTGRRVRAATRSGVAFLIAQMTAILVYSLIVAVTLILVRVKWGVSFDGWIDRLLGG